MRRCAAERNAPIPIKTSAPKAESRRSLGYFARGRAPKMPLSAGDPF
jgi:hypothetical protein